MSNLPGTNIIAPVVPFSEVDTYPTHEAKYGKGGYRTTQNKTARNDIPYARRELGMAVRTLSDNAVWILTNNPASAENGGKTQDSDWTKEVDTLDMDGGSF